MPNTEFERVSYVSQRGPQTVSYCSLDVQLMWCKRCGVRFRNSFRLEASSLGPARPRHGGGVVSWLPGLGAGGQSRHPAGAAPRPTPRSRAPHQRLGRGDAAPGVAAGHHQKRYEGFAGVRNLALMVVGHHPRISMTTQDAGWSESRKHAKVRDGMIALGMIPGF